jgi:hypothetical protein
MLGDGMNAYAKPEDADKAVLKGAPFGKSGVGTGGGTYVSITFTPHMWGPASFDSTTITSTGTAGPQGLASNPDEVLYHEMVHASRQMRGVETVGRVDKPYTNEEEYIAVVLSNIYLAEKGQKLFRAGHRSGQALQRPRGGTPFGNLIR